MKKCLIYRLARAVHSHFIIAAIVLVFLVPIFARAASEYDSPANVAAGVIGTAGTGATYELSPGRLFTLDSNFGQDMYRLMYDHVKHETSDLAVKRTLARRNLTPEELKILIPGSNIGEILNKKPNEQLKPEQVAQRRSDLEQDLADEKDIADLEVEVKNEVQPTELFANGDESDSGFDLIVDLDTIEQILFGKTQTVLGGAGPGAPAGSNEVNLGGGGGAPGAGKNKQAPGGGKQQQGGAGNGGNNAPSNNAGGANGGQGNPAAGGGAAQNAAGICALNQTFNSAALSAITAEQNAAGSGGGKNGADNNGNNIINGTSTNQKKPPIDQTINNEDKPPQPEPAGDWSRPSICGKTFCLQFEAVYKKASSYQATDNCIACHFEKINDAFKRTLDHNLGPSKATGNIGEGSKCKRNLIGLKWNIVLIKQPILTPPNDDLVVKGDFIKNAIKMWELYYDNPGRCQIAKKEGEIPVCKPDPDFEQQAASQALENAPPGVTQQDVISQIKDQAAAKRDEALRSISEEQLADDGVAQSSQFQVVLQEMDTMNGFFDGFLKLFQRLVSDQEDEPCTLLQNKEMCS